MPYTVEIDFAPAYELVVSLYAYVRRGLHKTLYLGSEWVRETRAQLSGRLAAELDDQGLEVLHRMSLLLWQCPGERTPQQFLRWLEQLPPGELYERLAPWVESLPGDLGDIRDRTVHLLSEWNEQYFSRLDPGVLANLAADGEEKRKLIRGLDPIEAVELISNGLRLEPVDGLKKVFLVPQFHCSPANVLDSFRGVSTCLYPVTPPSSAGEPPRELLLVTRCLADESRLRILRLLADKPRSFSDVLQLTGLAKSTVHHHLLALRFAGLIRSHFHGDTLQHYSLRETALAELPERLLGFFHSGPRG
ncbi:ArsR/SmtB family transcription factor [Brevibacillus massiliensis]|jgi:DNA-binding transcriptional ArsR family regulator|uniref:ArsR/SmtB family transcription factor n=1 Tax=Brevibacillus massiliensis TaxID=1118054 RepID=UPI0002E9B046|nr:ArsR family transcriptional regulator [Brevibacillus massiliensis]